MGVPARSLLSMSILVLCGWMRTGLRTVALLVHMPNVLKQQEGAADAQLSDAPIGRNATC